MKETVAEIKTADGALDTFVCHPDSDRTHPVVIIYMDAPGMRDELRDMASRLATAGYFVMLPNLYYRVGREGGYGFDLAKIRQDETHLKRMHECRLSLTNDLVVADTAPLIEFARAHPQARDGAIGSVGYCMSGSFVCAAASAYPNDFAAVASFYGVGIVTEEPDSPHLKAGDIRAKTYLAFASDDPWVPESVLKELPAIIRQTGWPAEVEIYPETSHGFAFPQRADYKRAAGERHWERIFDLMRSL